MKKKLGDAELEIMLVIWGQDTPLTSVQIREQLVRARPWSMPQVMTSLARLVDKGFVSCDRTTGMNIYRSEITEDEYKAQESQTFLSKLYRNSVPEMVNHLYSNKVIGQADIEDLRALLEKLDGEKE